MRLGLSLPTFSPDAGALLEMAEAAEEAGVHGLFCFDHLWPLGHPERPALGMYPVLGAVAARTDKIAIGSLVARVGLLPDAVVAASIEGLHAIVGDRLIAGVGLGDRLSVDEHDRNGIARIGRRDREQSLAWLLERLAAAGIERWVGAGRPPTNEVARRAGASLNLWQASPAQVADAAERSGLPVTWGGSLPEEAGAAAEVLVALEHAGATWVVWGWPRSIETLVEAARLAGIALEPRGGGRRERRAAE